MFKFIAVIFLTVHVALVLGIMTKEDLPEGIQNCLDDVLIPNIRLHASCKLSNDEDEQCKRIQGDNDENLKCLNEIDELQRTAHKFARAYLTNEYLKIMKYDLSSELPENVRNCIDTLKPILQADLQSGKDCEAFIRTDDSETTSPDPYQECLDKIPEVFEHPQSLKCIDIAETLTEKQKMFLEPYAFKVIFDL